MIYPYVICEPAPPPDCRGLGRARLRALEHDRLAAVYSRHRSLRPRPSPEALLAHDRVVEAAMARGPVLPLRFGTVLADESRLADELRARRAEFLRGLELVRGRVEIGLRAVAKRTGASTGRAYVEGLLQARRAGRDLHAPLAELAVASRLRERGAGPLTASYLVDRVEATSFRARAEELAAARDELSVVVTGPWPPYSFAE